MIPRHQEPIEFTIYVDRNAIIGKVVSRLNKIAESRFDGNNATYVNNMQPETDFDQDERLVKEYYDEGIGNIVRKVEPYVSSYGIKIDPKTEEEVDGVYAIDFSMPNNWRDTMRKPLETKIESYITAYIIKRWVEMTSASDLEYYTMESDRQLRGIKWVCELRKGAVHYGWNTTY